MEVTKSLGPVITLCQIFGLVSIRIDESKGKVVLRESRRHKMAVELSALAFVVLQLLLGIATATEMQSVPASVSAKFVKILHLTAFTCNMAAMYFTSIATGRLVCGGLNTLNELCEWFMPRHRADSITESNRWLLAGGLASYLLTVIPTIFLGIGYFSKNIPKLISYLYFALCLWLENAFLNYFVTVAHTIGHVYGSLTRLDDRNGRFGPQGPSLFRRRLLNENIVKDFVEAFSDGYRYALFFCVFWSYTMMLHYVLKPAPRLKVILWLCYIGYRMVSLVSACSRITREVSQAFGLVSFEARQLDGAVVLCESQKRLEYSKRLFAVFGLIQAAIFVKTIAEFLQEKGLLMVKIIRFLHMLTFTAAVASAYLTAITKGGRICSALNFVSRLAALLPRNANCRKALSENPRLMLWLLAYFPTVFFSVLCSIYFNRNRLYRVLRSSFFAFNIWQENLFFSQVYIIANTFRAVVVGYNESLLCLPPTADVRRLLNYVHKMKATDMFLKRAFHSINSSYQCNLLFGTSWFFMALIYFINRSTFQINFVFWALYVGIRMSSVISICDGINKEVEKTAHHLHELFIEFDDPQLKEEVEIFSLQLMHRKAEFNACGFFKLDFSLLHSMIATVSTYIIILMQLQGDAKVADCFKHRHCANCTVIT